MLPLLYFIMYGRAVFTRRKVDRDHRCLQRIVSEKCVALWIFFFTLFPVPILFISMFFITVNLNLDWQKMLDGSRVPNSSLHFPLVETSDFNRINCMLGRLALCCVRAAGALFQCLLKSLMSSRDWWSKWLLQHKWVQRVEKHSC